MHQHLIDVLAALDASRQALRESVAAIPPAVRTARPGADRWSPVDIVEHLSLVETRFSTVVGGKIAEALDAGLGAGESAARAAAGANPDDARRSHGEADGAGSGRFRRDVWMKRRRGQPPTRLEPGFVRRC